MVPRDTQLQLASADFSDGGRGREPRNGVIPSSWKRQIFPHILQRGTWLCHHLDLTQRNPCQTSGPQNCKTVNLYSFEPLYLWYLYHWGTPSRRVLQQRALPSTRCRLKPASREGQRQLPEAQERSLSAPPGTTLVSASAVLLKLFQKLFIWPHCFQLCPLAAQLPAFEGALSKPGPPPWGNAFRDALCGPAWSVRAGKESVGPAQRVRTLRVRVTNWQTKRVLFSCLRSPGSHRNSQTSQVRPDPSARGEPVRRPRSPTGTGPLLPLLLALSNTTGDHANPNLRLSQPSANRAPLGYPTCPRVHAGPRDEVPSQGR